MSPPTPTLKYSKTGTGEYDLRVERGVDRVHVGSMQKVLVRSEEGAKHNEFRFCPVPKFAGSFGEIPVRSRTMRDLKAAVSEALSPLSAIVGEEAFSKGKFRILFETEFRTTGLSETMSGIDRNDLCREYEDLRHCAPKRHCRGKKYLAKNRTTLLTIGDTNRFEEHLAIWLCLCGTGGFWLLPDMGRLRLLDYQVPLYAQQKDEIGEVDLLGVTSSGQLAVIELKVNREKGGDSPPAALMQGLGYAAIIEANQAEIAQEAKRRFDAEVSEQPPIVKVLAPKAWWLRWLESPDSAPEAAGNWESEFSRLAGDVEERLGIVVECLALDDLKCADIAGDTKPKVNRTVALYPVHPGRAPAIGSALPFHRVEA